MNDQMHFLTIIAFIRRYILLIISTMLISIIMFLFYISRIPDTYECKSLIYFIGKISIDANEISQNQLFSKYATNGNSMESLLLNYLNSVALRESIAGKACKIDNSLCIKNQSDNLQDNISTIDDMVLFLKRRPHEVEIVVRGQNPNSVKQINCIIIESLREFEANYHKKRLNSLSVEKAKAILLINSAETELSDYLTSNSILAVNYQTRFLERYYIDLNKQMKNLENEIEVSDRMLQEEGDLYKVEDLKLKQAVLKESKSFIDNEIVKVKKQLIQIPSVEMKFLRLQAETQILHDVLGQISKEYYYTLLKQDDSESFIVINKPERPLIRSYPSRKNTILAAILFGLVLGIILSYIFDLIRSRRRINWFIWKK